MYDPKILAMMFPQLAPARGTIKGAQYAGAKPVGQAPSQSEQQRQGMLAMLSSAGFIPKHYATDGRLLAPGEQQGGSGLDGTTYRGLDALHAMQQGRSDRYSSATFATPGMRSRVGEGKTMWTPQQRPPGPYQTGAPAATVTGLQPTAQELQSMQMIRQQVQQRIGRKKF